MRYDSQGVGGNKNKCINLQDLPDFAPVMSTCASYVVVGLKMEVTTPPVFIATTYQLSGGYFYKCPAEDPVPDQLRNFPFQKRGDAKGAMTSLYLPVESENLKSGFQPGITSNLGGATFEGFGIIANF